MRVKKILKEKNNSFPQKIVLVHFCKSICCGQKYRNFCATLHEISAAWSHRMLTKAPTTLLASLHNTRPKRVNQTPSQEALLFSALFITVLMAFGRFLIWSEGWLGPMFLNRGANSYTFNLEWYYICGTSILLNISCLFWSLRMDLYIKLTLLSVELCLLVCKSGGMYEITVTMQHTLPEQTPHLILLQGYKQALQYCCME